MLKLFLITPSITGGFVLPIRRTNYERQQAGACCLFSEGQPFFSSGNCIISKNSVKLLAISPSLSGAPGKSSKNSLKM